MEAVLLGAVPKPESQENGPTGVSITISTLGLYSDARDDKIYNFTSSPFEKSFQYRMTADGGEGEVLVPANYPSVDHA